MRDQPSPKIFRLLLPVGVSLLMAIATIFPAGGEENGLTIQKRSSSTNSIGQDAEPLESTMYFSSQTVHEVRSDGNESIVYLKEKRFVTLNNTAKTYSEVTFDELERKLDEVSKKMSEESAEQQEATEMLQRVLGDSAGQLSVEKLGPGEPILGFATEKHLITAPPMTIEIWAAPELKIPAEYYDSMKINAQPNPFFDMQKLFDAFKSIDGLSLRTIVTVRAMGAEIQSTDEVVSVEEGPVTPPRIPAEYRKVELDF
jgi:hypothetical protein